MIKIILRNLAVFIISLFLLGSSSLPPANSLEQVRAFTRNIEFDYVTWTLDALRIKETQSTVNASNYLSASDQKNLVLSYLELVGKINLLQSQVEQIYSDPNVADPTTASAETQAHLSSLNQTERRLAPVVESIIQQQISETIKEMGLSLAGQPLPPVLYHITPLPNALIVSPRDKIQQDANISLLPNISVADSIELEKNVESQLNVSALVVPIGGVGIYPTMVMSTTDLSWLLEVVAHEWTHNYLTWHPLGISYYNSSQLLTMNETTASISGNEIGSAALKKYYPELVPQPAVTEQSPAQTEAQPAEPAPFNYRSEMHKTRVQVDQLLAAGTIDEAEDYMEQRRRFFWDNGYQIRRLNQAYFAFYGSYADTPEGAAGEDPVGAAVRNLRKSSGTLAEFLNKISWMSTFEELQQAVH